MTKFPYPSENISSVIGLMDYANSITNGFLGLGILLVISVISFLVTKNYSSDKAFGFSMFITFLVALLLRFMNLITDAIFYIVIISFAGVTIYLWYSRQQEQI